VLSRMSRVSTSMVCLFRSSRTLRAITICWLPLVAASGHDGGTDAGVAAGDECVAACEAGSTVAVFAAVGGVLQAGAEARAPWCWPVLSVSAYFYDWSSKVLVRRHGECAVDRAAEMRTASATAQSKTTAIG
jgi:hypothetical protein